MKTDTIIELEYPITIKKINAAGKAIDVDITTIRLGRVKAKHLKLLPASFIEAAGDKKKSKNIKVNPEDVFPIIAGISGLSIAEIEEVDLADLDKLMEGLDQVMGE